MKRGRGLAGLRSMTGFSSLSGNLGTRHYRWRLRSVNSRFFEWHSHLPSAWAPFENWMRREARKRLQRGSFELWVEETSGEGKEESFDEALRELHWMWERAQAEGFSELSAETCARLWQSRGLRRAGTEETAPAKSAIEATTVRLFQLHDKIRREEGRELGQLLRASLRALEAKRGQCRRRWQGLARSWRLQATLKNKQGDGANGSRWATELSTLLEKRDVSEELGRIGIHLQRLRKLLSGKETKESGKWLEFFCQELVREWNTLGSKVPDARMSQWVVEAKLEIERLREQSLNLV